VSSGDVLEIDIEKGAVRNQTTGREFEAQPLTGYVMEILSSGGIKPLVKKQLERQNA
jgi:3-isopropylmalate/(R)-2-methylmalate dehydratase small subunit